MKNTSYALFVIKIIYIKYNEDNIFLARVVAYNFNCSLFWALIVSFYQIFIKFKHEEQ